MKMRRFGTGIGTALAVGFSVALAIQGNVSAGQNPPAAGGGQGGRGGGRGFNLPPLLMETDAFPDGGIVPPKFVGRGGVQHRLQPLDPFERIQLPDVAEEVAEAAQRKVRQRRLHRRQRQSARADDGVKHAADQFVEQLSRIGQQPLEPWAKPGCQHDRVVGVPLPIDEGDSIGFETFDPLADGDFTALDASHGAHVDEGNTRALQVVTKHTDLGGLDAPLREIADRHAQNAGYDGIG